MAPGRPRRAHGRGDFQQFAAARQTVRLQRRGERVAAGFAGQARVERLEPPGRCEQQRRGVAVLTGVGGQPGAHELRAGAAEFAERSGLGHGQQPQRRGGGAGLVTGAGGGQGTLGPAGPAVGQLGGASAECSRRGQAAPGLGLADRAFEFGGGVLVEPWHRVRAVPGAPVEVSGGADGFGQGAVGTLAFLRRGRLIERVPDQRIREPDLPAGLDKPGRGRRCCSVFPGAELGLLLLSGGRTRSLTRCPSVRWVACMLLRSFRLRAVR